MEKLYNMSKIWSLFIILGIIISPLTGNDFQITDAVINAGKSVIEISIAMYSIVPIWCGMMKIAEKSGLSDTLAKIMYPFIGMLFPELPKNSSALKHITTNITANMLGLGWAATPSGINAMKSLSKLNKNDKTASKSMCMFMVINMSSVQLITINILAYRSSFNSPSPSAVIFPGIIATIISTAVGIIAVKIAERR